MNFRIVSLMVWLILLSCGCATIEFSKAKEPHAPASPHIRDIDVALVLGGGGARGLAHVGVIEELLNAGIVPDLIVGCSVGAMVGAYYADTLDINLVRDNILQTKLFDILDIDISYLLFSLSGGKKLNAHLKNHIKARNFEELKMPFIAVATNLQFGNITAFGTGKLIPALRASAAFPGAFFPVKIGDQYFVDGGVANPIPVAIARRFNPKIVIAVDISEGLTEKKPNHMLGIIKRSLEISFIHQSDMAGQQADVVIKFPFKDIGTFNDELNTQIYEEGKKAALEKVEEIKALLQSRREKPGQE